MPVRTVLGIGFAVLLSSVPAAAYAQTMHHDGHQHNCEGKVELNAIGSVYCKLRTILCYVE